jgi:hypothetical protein
MRLAIAFLLLSFYKSSAQNIQTAVLLRLAYVAATSESEKDSLNTQYFLELEKILSQKGSFKMALDSLPHTGVVLSNDGRLRSITWNTADAFGQHHHHGFLQTSKGELIVLKDASQKMPTPELQILQPDKWMGTLYYKIFRVKQKGHPYYIMLGFDGNDAETNRKIIDVLYFDKALDRWIFGRKVFAPPFSDRVRFIIEYSDEVSVSLRYHPRRKQIVFDHLVPRQPGLEGIYSFYVPDMSFDALELRNQRWHFVQNIDIRGKKSGPEFLDPNTISPPSP